MRNPLGMPQGKWPIHLQDAFHREIRNLEKLGILEETKDVTEWVNSFVIMEKKAPDVSNSQSEQGNYRFALILGT